MSGSASFLEARFAEFERPLAELKRPIVLLVDYVHHKIERPTIEESEIESARKKGSV